MNKRDDWREWESCACDESQAATLGWETESQRRDDNAASAFALSPTADKSDAGYTAHQGRITVIGFTVVRL